jgi:predicted LPLAT superfamily acyltransferase
LAALLGCPVYLLFCLREGEVYRLYVERFGDRIVLPREDRDAALRCQIGRYAGRLEHYVMKTPFQWYNFFDFWA